jgi:hypothetical protein
MNSRAQSGGRDLMKDEQVEGARAPDDEAKTRSGLKQITGGSVGGGCLANYKKTLKNGWEKTEKGKTTKRKPPSTDGFLLIPAWERT